MYIYAYIIVHFHGHIESHFQKSFILQSFMGLIVSSWYLFFFLQFPVILLKRAHMSTVNSFGQIPMKRNSGFISGTLNI